MSSISEVGQKRLHGQFFTTTNPFNVDPFHKWLKEIPCFRELVFLEPFAGANNIVSMLHDLGYQNRWACFDIDPADTEENSTGIPVVSRDTLLSYPSGFDVAITNPPYLAKNSATRRGLAFPQTAYDDVYKHALAVMLANTQYVAAIVPESFLTQSLFHNRLTAVISLTCKMFEDTEVPVCLALFSPESTARGEYFNIYAESRFLGRYSDLRAQMERFEGDGLTLRFNDPAGLIGLYAIDGQHGPSIRFVSGSEIDSAQVKATSRSVTRIGCTLHESMALKLVQSANDLLAQRRSATKDAFMTAFKGLRHDGRYRRRLDFAQARELLNIAATREGIL